MSFSRHLTTPFSPDNSHSPVVVVVGEVIWDLFPDSQCLGGAPLNFAVHASRLGFRSLLLSAVGADELGGRAVREIEAFGLDTSMLQRSTRWKTGTASVILDASGQPTFQISRPAAYDDLSLTSGQLLAVSDHAPVWVYFGTLFASTPNGRITLQKLLDAIPGAKRFYDLNLRQGSDSPALISDLLARANIVKMNESEARRVSDFLGLPVDLEWFCRRGCERFGWQGICVTLGERGCAVFDGDRFIVAGGESVEVADTVGAGDAFAAAFVHGLWMKWPLDETARFANRVGALVASRAGGIPEWNMPEAALK